MTALRDRKARDVPPPSRARPPDLDGLYTMHAGFVWRTLRGMGVHDSAIADAVQDVFIVVHRRYPEFDHTHKVTTWLFEITYRVASEYRRKHARAAKLFAVQDDDAPSPEDSPAKRLEQSEAAKLLTELLNKLDEDKRAVLILSEIEGLNPIEIAELTGSPINTVYSRIRRARLEFDQLVAVQKRRQK